MALVESMTFRTVELHLQALYQQQFYDAGLWVHMPQTEILHIIERDALAIRLTGYMLADHLADDVILEWEDYPASFWQHTKAVHFPTISRWVRRPPRFDRVTKKIVVQNRVTFPQATIPYPEGLGPVRIMQTATEERAYRDY